MGNTSIEDFLELGQTDIQNRMRDVLLRLPSYPGVSYIKQRLREFEVQPWPFILYLAHWAPNVLRENLDSYKDYDGAENKGVIMEKLREYYIFSRLHEAAVDNEREKNGRVE